MKPGKNIVFRNKYTTLLVPPFRVDTRHRRCRCRENTTSSTCIKISFDAKSSERFFFEDRIIDQRIVENTHSCIHKHTSTHRHTHTYLYIYRPRAGWLLPYSQSKTDDERRKSAAATPLGLVFTIQL